MRGFEELYTEKHIIPLFLKACPGWQKDLDREKAAWGGEPSGLFLAMTAFARYIFTCYRDGDVAEFPKFSKTLELLVQEGDERVEELLMLGLMEPIYELGKGESLDLEVFKQWLKEESLETWNYLEKMRVTGK